MNKEAVFEKFKHGFNFFRVIDFDKKEFRRVEKVNLCLKIYL